MSAGARIAAFVAALGLVFAVASLAGAEISPTVESAPAEHEGGEEEMETHGVSSGAGEHTDEGAAAPAALPGLAVAEAGYRLVPDRTEFESGTDDGFGFRIVDSAGETVREFDTEHARKMHLIVVRRDFANFQHLHPRQRPDGSWEADLNLEEAGVYRAFADFAAGEESLTLATDLFAAGRFEPDEMPVESSRADAGDGYAVEIDTSEPWAGAATPISFAVTLDGRELDGVEPYLGADGHLVALRQHDQAFLHTHPEGEPGGSGPISFQVHYPTAGSYRLFLQFKHDGQVRTAAFTQTVETGTA